MEYNEIYLQLFMLVENWTLQLLTIEIFVEVKCIVEALNQR